MKTILFYFSATGNSLSIARKIAAKLEETKLIAIPKVNKFTISSDCKVGLIFSVYAWGMPPYC